MTAPDVETTRPERLEPRALELRFANVAQAHTYVCALSSLLYGSSARVAATLSNGTTRGDLTAPEIAARSKAASLSGIQFTLRDGTGGWTIRISPLEGSHGCITVDAPFSMRPPASHLWLQCDPDEPSPIRSLALPTCSGGLAADALHALVGLALRCGGFEDAEFIGEPRVSWSATKLRDDAQPVGSTLRDALWGAPYQTDGPVELWATGLHLRPRPRAPEPGWWEQYDVLTRSPVRP